jgi:hypothetical protein
MKQLNISQFYLAFFLNHQNYWEIIYEKLEFDID